jgi:hypothetical protein
VLDARRRIAGHAAVGHDPAARLVHHEARPGCHALVILDEAELDAGSDLDRIAESPREDLLRTVGQRRLRDQGGQNKKRNPHGSRG